ncbi:MAG TPA: Rieske 2Fe-2S domain-containing protein [Nitrososphaeraceae archaeon]|jgi:nitrite reductase/ring-hydroxylating ferredoxin subunit|nr:Rieske 2Fe-2S domain-containing protein [Nitrososphaeraceae archaeon]
MSNNESYVEVAKIDEIPPANMKHVELDGKEIVVSNVNGKFYAMDDRCGHMNARLSNGNINQNIVTCPFHAAKFDISTGKKVGEPVLEIPPDMEPLPPKWQKYMENVGKEMSYIKTYNQNTYEVTIEGDVIKIKT